MVFALVGIGEPDKDFFGLNVTVGQDSRELVRDRESKNSNRALVVGIDGEDVVADLLRLLRLVQVAINFGLRDGLGNAFLRDCLQCQFHKSLLFLYRIVHKK